MQHILVTGTSGFIGRQLAESPSSTYRIIAVSRRPTPVAGVASIEGDFTDPATLRRLDDHPLDAIVHLAAVTGGCDEADGLRVNVLGTHGLLRYALSRGCRKFVLASSIAAVGFQSVKFRPLRVPIPDEHPCLDRDGYGFSKYMMEEVTRYLARQYDDADFINIRLASIAPDDATPVPKKAGPLTEWSLGELSVMFARDAVRCFTLAVESRQKPGVRILNAVGNPACTADPIPDLLRAWYGPDNGGLDLSHYERPGHGFDPIYDISSIKRELSFVPERSVLER
ncbi:MAG: NAD(P)-dependent oxidoreductase [candidate division Zixibacteria bacterium]|nr:NAD(P)-dependent oxidoreductase [candidate division Zixibacteria bacterium]